MLDSIYKQGINIVLCGDFNIDSYSQNRENKNFCNILSAFNLKGRVFWPTRIGRTSVTTLDQIFMNSVHGGHSIAIDNTISDHRTVLFELNVSDCQKNKPFCTMKRIYSENAINQFCTDICNENWSALYNMSDVDSAFSYFHRIFSYHFEINFPLCRYRTLPKSNNTWINYEVKKSSEQLKDFYLVAKFCPEYNQRYREMKSKHKKLITETKRNFYQDRILSSSNITKATWDVISDITKVGKQRQNISLKDNNIPTNDPETIVKKFNKHFKDIPMSIISNMSKNHNQFDYVHIFRKSEQKMWLYPFTEEEFFTLISQKLKNKTSSGPDDIPDFLVKKVLMYIVKPQTMPEGWTVNVCHVDRQ
nr:unnamed protein product [Callosobruchus analis]